MSRLLLYNPENDIALASGLSNFTPPAVGRSMAAAGALLPFWWSEPADEVLIHPSLAEKMETLKSRFDLNGEIGYRKAERAEPWGWSQYTRTLLLRAGMSESALPSPRAIERMRELSHRRTTIAIHQALGTEPELIPVEAYDVEGALRACRQMGAAVVKQPWSCSGRGVFFTRNISGAELSSRLAAALRRQGALLIEPEYDRQSEFAALYYAEGGRVEYRSMSLFTSDALGGYTGNLVAPAEVLERECGADALSAAMALEPVLTEIIGNDYHGWLGVDMLRHSGGINPCMEINLRMTMGVVAHKLARRLSPGVIRIVKGAVPDGAIDLSPTGEELKFIYQKVESSL